MNRNPVPRNIRYWRNLALFSLVCISVAALTVTLWLAHQRAMVLVHPARIPVIRTPDSWSITGWEQVTFFSADGLKLQGWFIPPDYNVHGATLIFVHGLGNNRTDLMAEVSLLSNHGYGALVFDLRNHGESDGTMTTLGFLEVDDIRGAFNYLQTRLDVDSERIGLLGNSMGAGIVIQAAARIPGIRAVIAQSGFTSLEDNVSHGVRALLGLSPFPFAPLVVWFGEMETGLDLQQVRPIDEIGRISPRAVLLIHGEFDPVLPFSNSLRLFEAAGDPKELYIVPEAEHGGFLLVDPQGYQDRVLTFLDKYLGNP